MLLYVLLIAVIVIQAIIHFIERRDMYNRLMSKDLSDYHNNSGKIPPKKHIPSAHSLTLQRWRNKAGDE